MKKIPKTMPEYEASLSKKFRKVTRNEWIEFVSSLDVRENNPIFLQDGSVAIPTAQLTIHKKSPVAVVTYDANGQVCGYYNRIIVG